MRRAQGVAWIMVVISAEGRVVEAFVCGSSGDPGLDSSALQSAWTATFKPATRDGRPVPSSVALPIKFSLHG